MHLLVVVIHLLLAMHLLVSANWPESATLRELR